MDYMFRDKYEKQDLIEGLSKVVKIKPWLQKEIDRLREWETVEEWYATHFVYYIEDIIEAEVYGNILFGKYQKAALIRFCNWVNSTAIRLYNEEI